MPSPPETLDRRPHIIRLALFAAFLLLLFYLVAVQRVIDIETVRGVIARSGPIAPLIYIPASALLASIFVPGPLLAAGSGLLFGPVLGTFVTLGSTTLTAVIAALIGRRAGRDSARALIGAQWAERIDSQIQRRGLWAVVGQRFIPGISDALASYTFGAFGLPLWQMAIGVDRLGAPGVRLHRTGGLDLRSHLTAGLCGDRGVVRHGDHRGVRRTSGLPKLARPASVA